MKNPAVPKAFGTAGYLNVMNYSSLYSLANPAASYWECARYPFQKIIKFLFPKNLFHKIEEESKKWLIECDNCGYSISYWDAGGLRAYATKKKRIWGFCPHCKKYKFFNVAKVAKKV